MERSGHEGSERPDEEDTRTSHHVITIETAQEGEERSEGQDRGEGAGQDGKGASQGSDKWANPRDDDDDDGRKYHQEPERMEDTDPDAQAARAAEHPKRSSPRDFPNVRQLFTIPSAYDPSKETHYVLVIHGTFDAPPEPAPPLSPSSKHGPSSVFPASPAPQTPQAPRVPWYWLDRKASKEAVETNFCSIIGKHLAATPLGADAVWRELPDTKEALRLPDDVPYPFHWDGQNTHQSRVEAGECLAYLINALGKADPSARVHVIAHSHGGNVLLKAISKYLTILRKEAGKSYNDRITTDFWEAHGEAYQEIRKHQRNNLSSLLLAFVSPFLVLKRPWLGDEALGLFPWGYFETTDRLLVLGRRRQAKFLRKKWAASSSTNCLGRLVFLGTPFYSKYWDRHAFLAMSLNIILLSFLVFLVIVGGAVFFRLITTQSAARSRLTGSELTFWIVASCVAVAMVLYNTLRDKRYLDGNLYFTEKKAWSPAMKALVLNAGKLDEAALALSTEPIVRAYMMPQVRAMLTPDPWRMLKPFPAKDFLSSLATLYNNMWVCLWNLVLLVPYLFLYFLNFILVPYFSNQLLRLFMTLGFGLQKGELDYARVYVEEFLRLPPASHDIVHWNVQKILTAESTEKLKEIAKTAMLPSEAAVTIEALEETKVKDEPNEVAQRWRFLWDEEELDKKAAECTTLHLLRDEMRRIQHNPRTTRVAFERELKLICVTLEERYKDMTGSVELSHGSYFRNRVVIAVIAHFLAHGELPSWASSLGETSPQRVPPSPHASQHPVMSRLFSRKQV